MKILDIEQGSAEWLQSRIGKVTGTRLAKVMGTPATRRKLMNELIAERLTDQYPETYKSADMQRGNDEEPFAAKAYATATKQQVEEVGFCISDKYDWLALSPDRLIKEGDQYVKAVEIKCPDTSTQIGYLQKKSIPSQYRYQVANYFLVCETIQSLDFVTYDPRIKIESLQMMIFTVTREEMQPVLDDCWESLQKFGEELEVTYQELTF